SRPAADPDPGDPRAEDDRAARRAHVVGERQRDRAVVGDPGRRRMERRDPGGVRLHLAKPVAVEPPEAGDAVRRRAALELAEPLDLPLVERDDELPALLERESAGLAVRAQELGAAAAELCLQRAGGVVDPRVDDAAV